jgi:hypothetical protein
MHDHDHELIAAIAEGGMNPDERAAAETSIASCEVCRIDLQLQREALASLRAAPAVAMTDIERAALHRTVAAALVPPFARSERKKAAPWFQRLMPAMAAAAALLVVVGIGSVLVDGGGDADMASETTAAGESLRTAVDEEMAETPLEVAEAPAAAESDDGAGATTTIAAGASAPPDIQEFGSIAGADLSDVALRLGGVEDVTGTNYSSAADLQSLSSGPPLLCAEIALAEGTITAIGRATVDGDEVEIYRIDDVVNVYATVDCSLTVSIE